MAPSFAASFRFLRRICGGIALTVTLTSCGKPPPPAAFTSVQPGLDYFHETNPTVPWSIHVVRIDRSQTNLSIHSVHADQGAVGLATLSEQAQSLDAGLGRPVAAVNGDFYQRDRAYAGDPRGLQISEGELLSAPAGGISFWIDRAGQPHIGRLGSGFRVTWPDGSTTPFGLNSERRSDELGLYSPAVGSSTHTSGGREWVLQPMAATNPPIFSADSQLNAVVREVRMGGNSPLASGFLVLSAGPALAPRLPKLTAGALVQISTTVSPGVDGARTAISGGPILVHEGRPAPIEKPAGESYESRSMEERHPRSAVGWNRQYFYLVEVDGRQPRLSVGMTLNELAAYLVGLGCAEAMTLDGGGSATLWCDGRIKNRPCEGRERPIANSLVVTRRSPR